jgi:membrane protease YdiL (CAAX protease family)
MRDVHEEEAIMAALPAATAAVPAPGPSRAPARVNLLARRPLTAYFALAFAGSWLALLPVALARGEHALGLLPYTAPEVAVILLFVLATVSGPLLAAVLVTGAVEGRAGVRRLLGRIIQWRVGLRWYVVALLAPLTIWLAVFSLFLGGQPAIDLLRQWPLLLTAFLPAVAAGLLIPSLGEEPGWRGFALPRMQRLYGPVAASLILGALHGLWHLPAFFMPVLGPFGPDKLASFILTAMAATFLYTWVFNGARGSVLLAMLLHAASNAASMLLTAIIPADPPLTGWARAFVGGGWISVFAFGAAAALLVILTRGRLGYRETASAGE